jgi:molecular chaperone DnaK (HSP70)
VPASFDEEARELTVMAAEQAGLPKLITPLEEAAACAGIRAILGLEHG